MIRDIQGEVIPIDVVAIIIPFSISVVFYYASRIHGT
jgi:hypothetical protein